MAFKCPRWTLANILPVAFVLWIMSVLWCLYVLCHLVPTLRILTPKGNIRLGVLVEGDGLMMQPGVIQTIISQSLTFMVLFCFVKAVNTDPGSVPQTEEWMPTLRSSTASKKGSDAFNIGTTGSVSASVQRTSISYEQKRTGGQRFCKWCSCFKPDRAHHCRICRSCILRMDHHCPWIANCIGFNNYKYFFLLVFYSLLNVLYIAFTMVDSLNRVMYQETTLLFRFLVVFGMTLAGIMSTLLVLFFSLHVTLIARGVTTIEFCEKARNPDSQASIYNTGCMENFKMALGPNILFWLVPASFPEGDGLTYKVTDSTEQERLRRESQSSASSDSRSSSDQASAADDAARSPGKIVVTGASSSSSLPNGS